jgi:2,4-dienoyl-CoA reductase-like NADH-dependent reductase (Old Yellow Enzyme family)
VGALIRRLWAEFFIGARVSDAELQRLTGLQPHHLLRLAAQLQDAQTAAIEYSKHGRMWRLRYTLPAACSVRWCDKRG